MDVDINFSLPFKRGMCEDKVISCYMLKNLEAIVLGLGFLLLVALREYILQYAAQYTPTMFVIVALTGPSREADSSTMLRT